MFDGTDALSGAVSFLSARVRTINFDQHGVINVNAGRRVENHAAAVALHAMYYNFVRIHQTLKVSPAMAAGVTDRLWEMTDVVEMIEAWEALAAKRSA